MSFNRPMTCSCVLLPPESSSIYNNLSNEMAHFFAVSRSSLMTKHELKNRRK